MQSDRPIRSKYGLSLEDIREMARPWNSDPAIFDLIRTAYNCGIGSAIEIGATHYVRPLGRGILDMIISDCKQYLGFEEGLDIDRRNNIVLDDIPIKVKYQLSFADIREITRPWDEYPEIRELIQIAYNRGIGSVIDICTSYLAKLGHGICGMILSACKHYLGFTEGFGIDRPIDPPKGR